MAETTFKPSEAAITKVLEKYSPRQVAIAYLRASRRARSADTAFNMLDGLTEANFAARDGDLEAVVKHLEKVNRFGRTHKETGEA